MIVNHRVLIAVTLALSNNARRVFYSKRSSFFSPTKRGIHDATARDLDVYFMYICEHPMASQQHQFFRQFTSLFEPV